MYVIVQENRMGKVILIVDTDDEGFADDLAIGNESRMLDWVKQPVTSERFDSDDVVLTIDGDTVATQ